MYPIEMNFGPAISSTCFSQLHNWDTDKESQVLRRSNITRMFRQTKPVCFARSPVEGVAQRKCIAAIRYTPTLC